MSFKKNTLFFLLLAGLVISCKPSGDNAGEVAQSAIQNKISLAQWSYHKALFAGEMDNIGFINKAAELGFEGVEFVNAFFKTKARDTLFLDSLKSAAAAKNIALLLIMIDGEGGLGDTSLLKRDSAVENHKKWVDAAKYLGCHSIRVNAYGQGTAEEVGAAATDGLKKVSMYGKEQGINVIVENHGSYSSNGAWLANVIKNTGMDNCGTLPDFGNFCIRRAKGALYDGKCEEEYDRYKGVEEMMPYAKALSAKSHDFDVKGEETATDYGRMLKIAHAAGYSGYIGVEYEGSVLTEEQGVIATRDLLRAKLK
jgi:sugar phosphate isomerase/epimerase